MATKEEKEAAVAARQSEVQAVVAQRSRRESGALPAPKMRASGDLSRYNIGYSDDPYAVPFTDMSGSAGELPPPDRVDVTPPGRTGGSAPPPPSRRSPQPPPPPAAVRAPRPTAPPRTQPGSYNVRTPSGGYRRVSEGGSPQPSGTLYESNPRTSVTTASARARFAAIQKGKLERSTPSFQKVTSSTGVTRTVSSGRQAGTVGKPALYEGRGGVIKSAPKKAPVAAKATAAKKVNAAKPAAPKYKAVKK
jgi:hypothetical protein